MMTQDMKIRYGYSMRIAREMANPCKGDGKPLASSKQALGKAIALLSACHILAISLLSTCLELTRGLFSCVATCRFSHSNTPFLSQRNAVSLIATRRFSILVLLMMVLGVNTAWGQPSEGLYFIANYNNKGYPTETTANHYYLVPAADPKQNYYIDAYYSANFGSENGDSNQPFLTTYKTNKDANSVWRVENVPGETGFYYIIHQQTGRYVIYEPVFSGNNSRRKCMHLKTTTTPGNEAKFEITVSETGYAIRPMSVASGNCYFNIASANTNDYHSTGPSSGSPTYFNGLVGLYTDPKDKNGVWFFEKATIDPPTITNNETVTNTFTITAATGATIYYTTDGSTPTTSDYTGTGTTSVNVDQAESMTVIKAIAKGTSDHFPTIVTTYNIPACERPVISVSGGIVTITCPKAGAAIYYTTNGDPATASSTPYNGPFDKGDASTIRAVATKAGYLISSEAKFMPPTEVFSSSEMTDMNGNYLLTSSFTSTGSVGTSANPFKGTIDGNLNSLTLSYPLVAYADGATIKNVILDNDNVTISDNENGNAGAICCEATGDTRIYNCGVLGGSVEGSNNVGGIVGLLDGRSRVINCYNYAKITSGSNCGGIVGYNNVASTSGNLQTMVMNCMFYGNITGGNAAPIYGGKNIHNKYASEDNTGLNNYCYFLYDEEKVPYVTSIAGANYHGALGAEERYLNRFEFFRMTLNSTRNLAAYYATGDATQKGEMAKWVLDKSIAPYPILKVQDKYPSVVNPDAAHATTQTERNKGGLLGTLSVTISGTGSGAVFGAPTGASITTGSLTLNITDKDYDNFNYNYKKVQLPYYNEVGEGNYTGGRVVTGWKITSITGGTSGSFTTDTYDYPSFNFVDRKCTNKDLFSESGRVFAQGAYWEVPDGVTAITIEPYWAKAVYLSDANYDVTYSMTFSGSGSSMTATANKYGVTVCGSCPTVCNEQTVYTDLSTALTDLALTDLAINASHKVYDYAVVLVGNYHQAANDALVNNGLPVTFMSADLDGDNEPDNTLFYYHNMRKSVSPVRFDFLNIPGIGMVKRTHDSTMDPEPGIFCPKGWFEVTNTVFIRFGQFEYAGSSSSATGTPAWPKTILAPLILQGGIYEQFVSCCRTNAQNTNYLLIGGNAWFKNFANGCHTAYANKTPKVPINVAGGDYTNFYLTGIYQPASNEPSENAECYIDGGRFTEVAGAGMQQIKGNVTWLINAADITSFYGGGINDAKPITGSISTTISNSYVDEFYGGPKFGDMEEEKTVTTNATDCHFGKFFGAGYGGTAFNKVLPTPTSTYDSSSSANTRSWNSWVDAEYKREYNATNGGISTDYDYEFILHSDGNQTVARFYVNYASLSLAATRNVTSTLSGCTIGTFYGGGNLGAVNGDVNSTLTNCTVTGNAFGAGFSASVPTVDVWNKGAYLTPSPTYNRTANVFNNASVKTPKDNGQYVVYTWSNSHGSNDDPFVSENGKYYIHTDQSLDGLGAVTGKVTLTINGNTVADENGKVMTVAKSVYGGGEESAVNGNTEVKVNGGTIGTADKGGAEYGNVYGGGKGKADDAKAGLVKGNTTVKIGNPESLNAESPFVYHNVYGGGAYGSVGTYVYYGETAEYTTEYNKYKQGGTAPDAGKLAALLAKKDLISSWTSGGTTNIEITGGTIGTTGENNGMVFGSSRGDVAKPVDGLDYNDRLAWVNETHVVIGDENKGTTDNKGDGKFYEYPLIKGSVYGSGENGHTFHNTYVKVHSGTIGIESGEEVAYNGAQYSGPRYLYRGNVYGGGCGTDQYSSTGQKDSDGKEIKDMFNFLAGIVLGNTNVEIDGGHIVHNVYGGGAMGSVGTFNSFVDEAYNTANKTSWPIGKPVTCKGGTGVCNVTVTGGEVGTKNMKMDATGGPDDFGHVFGAGRGDAIDPDLCKNIEICGYFGSTELTVKGKAFVRGSVYGGSESGHVLGNTHVVIGGDNEGDNDCQIGGGDGVDNAYSSSDWETESANLKPTHHWNYIDDGAPYDMYADESGKYMNGKLAMGGYKVATDGHTFYGNVFAGGSGYYPFAPGEWLFSAGRVEGNATLEIKGGHILNNVYGGCEMSDVLGDVSVTMTGGTIGVPRTKGAILLNPTIGHIYGAGMGDKRIFFNTVTNVASSTVNVSGGRVYGSVHGGGEDGHVLGLAKTTIRGNVEIGSVTDGTTSGFDGNVFGGGQGSPTALTAGTVGGNVELNIQGGTMYGSVYGGGRIASVGTYFAMTTMEDPKNKGQYIPNPLYGKMQDGTDHGYIKVNLTGGTIHQSVYGGCMGTRGMAAVDQVRFAVSKNVTVELNKEVEDNAKGCIVKGNIFGCNNVNSSPQEDVTVHIYKTQNALASQIAGTVEGEGAVQPKVIGRFDVNAVYGGGNMAAYLPKGPGAATAEDGYDGKNTTYSTKVIIDGCDRTSIKQVYGGGNAASTPATEVTVNGTYEIDELFGGGNGADRITYDEGVNYLDNPGANVGFYDYSAEENTYNTKEKRTTDENLSPTFIEKYVYGTGVAALNVYGGLINHVFGGSNTKGNVRETAITLLEEKTEDNSDTPCCPFRVGDVYGGGKSAPMDADAKMYMACIPGLRAAYGGAENADIQGGVTLNITNGRFDRVFGGNNISGTIHGPIEVNIEETGCRPVIIGELYGGGNLAAYSVYGYNDDGSIKESGTKPLYKDPVVNVKSFTSIGKVFGGGYGSTATVVGSPTVNINVAMGDKATHSDATIGENAKSHDDGEGYPVPSHESGKIGAITNVYGGGNEAKVIGNTNVNIGTVAEVYMLVNEELTVGTSDVSAYYTRTGAGTSESKYVYTKCAENSKAAANVTYYEKNTVVGADIRGNVYGGGNNAEVTGNTNVTIGKKKVTTP